jgi:hypothetical protein
MASGAERRKRVRVTVSGEVQGRIHTVQAAPVLDISETGALLEVPCSLRPGAVYLLHLPIEGGPLTLQSRVVRSFVHGLTKKADGETVVQYRTAVEFLGLTDTARARLQVHIGSHGGAFDEDFEA